MAANLDLDFALFHKERKKANEIARMVLVGNVEGKTAILIDDMADTCGTLALAAKHLLAGGAKTVLALVTHGILSGKAMKVLNESNIEKLIVTNSIPQHNVRFPPFIPLRSLRSLSPSPLHLFSSFRVPTNASIPRTAQEGLQARS
jgi:phosphoribosylpyrophosphate synthetase